MREEDMDIVGIDPGKHDLIYAVADDYLTNPYHRFRYNVFFTTKKWRKFWINNFKMMDDPFFGIFTCNVWIKIRDALRLLFPSDKSHSNDSFKIPTAGQNTGRCQRRARARTTTSAL
jgi:hypothetical protein